MCGAIPPLPHTPSWCGEEWRLRSINKQQTLSQMKWIHEENLSAVHDGGFWDLKLAVSHFVLSLTYIISFRPIQHMSHTSACIRHICPPTIHRLSFNLLALQPPFATYPFSSPNTLTPKTPQFPPRFHNYFASREQVFSAWCVGWTFQLPCSVGCMTYATYIHGCFASV